MRYKDKDIGRYAHKQPENRTTRCMHTHTDWTDRKRRGPEEEKTGDVPRGVDRQQQQQQQ